MNIFIKNSIILIVLAVFFTACTSNTIYKKPKDLISKNQMIDLLADMYLANAASNVKTIDLKRKMDFMPLIYEKYGVDSLRFHTSNVYYMSQFDEYEAIYKKVEKQLKKMLDTTKVALKLKDSLNKIKSTKDKKRLKEQSIKEKLLKEGRPKNYINEKEGK